MRDEQIGFAPPCYIKELVSAITKLPRIFQPEQIVQLDPDLTTQTLALTLPPRRARGRGPITNRCKTPLAILKEQAVTVCRVRIEPSSEPFNIKTRGR